MIILAKWIVIIFGLFLIFVGLLMLFAPIKAREVLRKAASSNFINYAEITIRMIPALALILYSDFSKFPEFFKALGWLMLITSFVLFIVPRRIHYNFSQKSADILRPIYIQLISSFSFLFGSLLIYSVV